MKAGCRGTLQYATGVGKTRAAIMAIKGFVSKNSHNVVVVVVPTEYLKAQWMQELSKYGLFFDVKVEIINTAIKSSEKIDFLILDKALSRINLFNCGKLFRVFSTKL